VLAGLIASVASGVLAPAGARQPTARPPNVIGNIASFLPGGKNVDPDVIRLNNEIDSTFASALAQLSPAPPKDSHSRIVLLGKLMLYDKTLSVEGNLACTTCHLASSGFTGGSSLFNQTIVADPGSVPITNAAPGAPNWRISGRKPQSYGYAAFAPILEYNATQKDFYGGNFWDMRATGDRLGNCAAEQAEGPFLNPLEHGFADAGCVVYRVSQSKYRALFEQVWGPQSFAVTWPANIEQVSRTPGPAPATDPLPVHLSAIDRGIVNDTYDHIAMSIAAYEASPEVSAFSSKFDYALANPTKQVLRADELAGWNLFRGKAKCNTCHLDGTENLPSGTITPRDATNVAPLFTDFTSSNLGLPKNTAMPFYNENTPDQTGYVANPAGPNFTDLGVGAFLAGTGAAPDPNATQWAPLAPQFNGKFQVPTLRNVDKRPRPDFVKAYMHEGYLKSLKEVVHFYNTRDALPQCTPGSPGEKVTCWPPSEVGKNKDTTIGKLGLTDQEENQIVAFLQTLTDGFKP
jgi:cytochrome c peroxidase